jgi:hypothetical protein
VAGGELNGGVLHPRACGLHHFAVPPKCTLSALSVCPPSAAVAVVGAGFSEGALCWIFGGFDSEWASPGVVARRRDAAVPFQSKARHGDVRA